MGNMAILFTGNVPCMKKLDGGVAVGSNNAVLTVSELHTAPMKLSHAALLKMLKAQAAAAAKNRLKAFEVDPNLLKGLDDLPNALAGMNGGMANKDDKNLTKEEEVTMDTCFEATTQSLKKIWCNQT